MNHLRRPGPKRAIGTHLSGSVVCCGLFLACANDVVLGEHITTTSTTEGRPNTATASTTAHGDSSERSLPDDSTRCYFPAFPDGGKPNINDDRRDEDDWRRDGGLDFDDCWPLDAGRRPPVNPEHQMGEEDTFGPKPSPVDPRPGDPPLPSSSAPIGGSNAAPAGSDPFSD